MTHTRTKEKAFLSTRKSAVSLLILTLALVSSCGYKFAGQETKLPDPIKTIAVAVFVNDTKEPNLELAVTGAITEKFQHDGRLAVVSAQKADSLLSGTIEKYSLEPLVYDAYNNAAKYRVRIKVKIKFEDKVGQGLLVEKALDVQWDYLVGPSVVYAELARQEAVNQAASYLGDKMIGLLLEGF
jgi:hypothetical protein